MKKIAECLITKSNEMIQMDTGHVKLTYYFKEGVYDLEYQDSPYPSIKGIGFQFRFQKRVYTQEHIKSSTPDIFITERQDTFGTYAELCISRIYGELKVKQYFSMLPQVSYLLVRCEIEGKDIIRSNYIAPMISTGEAFSLKDTARPRLLYVPYDNDKWTRFKAQEMQECGISYEVTAVYDDDSRNGYIIGSISHDHWKTGIKSHGGYGSLSYLEIYGGAADSATRDMTMPHGEVKGRKIVSPLVFIGYDQDFRKGLIEYGNANNKFSQRLPWNNGVPFGWNSWACLTTNINLESFLKSSETINDLKQQGFHNQDTVYINFDAFWDNLTKDELKQAVEIVHQRGQKAGIYYTPYACWTNNFDQIVEDTNGTYTYRDILLRDIDGNPIPAISGGYPIDPTHPGNLKRVKAMMEQLVDMEFDYLKVDFMSHGSCEGVHYLSTVTTGVEAYRYGLDHMLSFLTPKAAGRPIFIDFSIAPIFPYGYAHARRISCDAFGQIKDTEYMLNSLTYGFWQNNTIYQYNDPDHTCLYQSVGRPVSEFNEAQSRLHASVIAGTVVLLSDDYNIQEAVDRTKKLLKPELLAIAKKGTTFLPVETDTKDRASRIFMREEEEVIYLAIFNFQMESLKITIERERLGTVDSNIIFQSIYDKEENYTGSSFLLELEALQSKILVGRK